MEPSGQHRELVAGTILFVLGLVFLAIRITGSGGQYVLVAVGVAFLLAYVWSRDDDLLAPGSLITGLGLGIALQPVGWEEGTSVLLGLGVGLLGMYVLSMTMTKRPNAPFASLIPGTALLVLGLLEALADGGLLRFIARWWPLAPVVAGGAILWRQFKSGSTRAVGPAE
ncbi:MAG: hypothetical protein QN178_02970 [Armatimonadota bacterium]|nr:hypothetical protein [Armatimonadota bacterium]